MADSNENDLGSILTNKREADAASARDLALDLERKRAEQERAQAESEQARTAQLHEQIRQLTERKQALEAQSAELDAEPEAIIARQSEAATKGAALADLYEQHSDILKREGYQGSDALTKVGSEYRGTKQVKEVRQARVNEKLQHRATRRTHRKIVAELADSPDLETKGRAPNRDEAKQTIQVLIDRLDIQIQELHGQTPEGHAERVEAVRTELRNAVNARGSYYSVRSSVDKIQTVESGDLILADSVHRDGPEVVKDALRDGFQARLDQETQAERERRNLPMIEQDLERLRAFPREVAQAQRLIGEACGLRQQAVFKVQGAGREDRYLHSLELNAGIDDSFDLYREPEEYFTRQCQRTVDNWTAMFGSAQVESSQIEQVGRHMAGLDSGRHVRVIDDPRMLLNKLERYKQLYARIIEMPAEELPTGSHPEVTVPPTGSVDARPQVITSKWSLESKTRDLLGRYPAELGFPASSRAVEQATDWTAGQEAEVAAESERAKGLLDAKIDWDWSDQELSRYQREHSGSRDLEQKANRIVQEREAAAKGLLTLAELRTSTPDMASDPITVGESFHKLYTNDQELIRQRDENEGDTKQLIGELGQHANIPEHRLNSLKDITAELERAGTALTELRARKRPRWGGGKEYDRFLRSAEESFRILGAIKVCQERWEAIRNKMELVHQVVGPIENAGLSSEFVNKTMPLSDVLDTLQTRLEAKSTAELTDEERQILDENTRLQSVQRAKRGDFMARYEAPILRSSR